MKKQGSGVRGQGPEKRPGISAVAVREVLREFPGSACLEVADLLQVQTQKDHDRVKQILHDQVRSGAVMRECLGDFITYRLTDKPGRGGVQAKLWEFACLRFATAKPFGVAEAARLAECDRDYTKRYYRWLWKSGYLAIVSRGKANVVFYQVVGGKEHEAAPAWNRRAEKRKRSAGETPAPLIPPAVPAAAGIITRDPAITFFDEEIKGQEEIPPSPPLEKGGDEAHRLQTGATRLDAALEEFGAALVEVAGGIERAWEIIREMKGELLAIEEQGHDEPGEPTAGGH
jgi:hypothetical protein